MGNRNFPVISIGEQTGTREATVGAAGKIAIPTMESGTKPKFLYCVAIGGTSTNIITISPTQDTNGAEATGLALTPANPVGVILNVHGFTHIGFDEVTGGDGTTDLYLYPLEDF
jgi:hypothetical protein